MQVFQSTLITKNAIFSKPLNLWNMQGISIYIYYLPVHLLQIDIFQNLFYFPALYKYH